MDVVGVVPGALADPAGSQTSVRGWLVFDDGSAWPIRRSVAIGRCPLLRPAEIGGVDAVFVADPSMSRRHLTVHLTKDALEVVNESTRDTRTRDDAHLGVTPVPIEDGFSIQCGQTAIRCLMV